ncbi:MAG: AAA family ATPase [Anaerolineae bacterium]|nr:AAA family ATPase [Anaerolineae bacterium]
MSIQKYPVGHQDFAKIITQGFVYVDKTRFMYQLADRGGYVRSP